MNDITLTLTAEETQSVLNVLGELPTKSGFWPLAQKIMQQAQSQLATEEPQAAGLTD